MQLLILFVFFSVCLCAKLPPNFKKCDRKQTDFQTCLPVAVDNAFKQMTRPIKELGLPSLNPLEVASLTIQAAGFTQHFTDLKMYGLTNTHCPIVSIDFKKLTIEQSCIHPEIRIVSNYTISGSILILDVQGSGLSVITLDNVKASAKHKLEEYEKNGQKHLKSVEINMKVEPEKVHFRFDNLFNGDKILSDNIHQVLNDNWKTVYGDVSSSYDEAFGQITRGTFNALFSRVSVSDLFGEE